ncbi:uncharacterized protein LOC134187805 [Corticium candelabrum]|uniref:uncharacterized protein LOC134187805 n=1 Tax=Corticium candelabrum TaxID=121492 RepID=UPI002E26054E|nr:uncharacterized protein LOC134187805 [Corticium candelabrum]
MTLRSHQTKLLRSTRKIFQFTLTEMTPLCSPPSLQQHFLPSPSTPHSAMPHPHSTTPPPVLPPSSPSCLPSSSLSASRRYRQPRQRPRIATRRPQQQSSSDSDPEPAQYLDRRSDPLNIQKLSEYPPIDTYQLNLPSFLPSRQPGFYFPPTYPTDAIGVFKLFFIDEMLETIRINSNINGEDSCKKTYCGKSGGRRGKGSFRSLTLAEMNSFIGLMIYMGLVKNVPELSEYWSTTFPFHGLWARRFMTRNRFVAILSVLQMENPRTDKDRGTDPLRKVRGLIEAMPLNCIKYGQPHARVSLHERMVKAKGCFGFRQYINNKPVKWGEVVLGMLFHLRLHIQLRDTHGQRATNIGCGEDSSNNISCNNNNCSNNISCNHITIGWLGSEMTEDDTSTSG